MSKHVAAVAADAEAAAILVAGLADAGYRVSHLAPGADLGATLRANAVDIVFNAAERSGRLAGQLELLGMPYTHSGVLASALAANRHQAKIVLRAAGVPVTDVSETLTDGTDYLTWQRNTVNQLQSALQSSWPVRS